MLLHCRFAAALSTMLLLLLPSRCYHPVDVAALSTMPLPCGYRCSINAAALLTLLLLPCP
jgi:hypothetical protein